MRKPSGYFTSESGEGSSRLNFVRQQGFRGAGPEQSGTQYTALMLQPRMLGILVLVGLVLQSWVYFLALSALLCWNALLPGLNPFDTLYNRFIARLAGLPRLDPAPPPRRFAEGMAATFLLVIALALLRGANALAWTIEGLLVAALAALIFGRFCLGSYLYWLMTGQAAFANRTLPWSPKSN